MGKSFESDVAFIKALAELVKEQELAEIEVEREFGDDNELIPLDVKAGDRILFGKWSGTEVKIEGEELLIMKESDIMGVLEG